MEKQYPVTEKKYERYYELANKASFRNSGSVLGSSRCGCYFCRRIFSPDEITDFVDSASTAICPYCGIDAVIGDASGIPIREDVLEELYERWFGHDEEPRCVCVVSDDCLNLPSLLDNTGVEPIRQGQFDKEQPEELPNCYCFRGDGENNLHMASWFKSRGVPAIWYPLQIPDDDDCECAALSDVIIFTGGDPTDTRIAERAPGALVVRTLGKNGLLYRQSGGTWSLLQPTEDIGCDFNKAADYITVSIISDLCLIGESLGTLHEKETETILANATKYVIELAK